MPIIYKGKSAARVVYRDIPVKKVYKGSVQVYIFGWITRAIVTWSLQSRPSKKEVPNPAYAEWEKGRPPYVTAYKEAKRAYDEWLLREPTKMERNPAYDQWLRDKKPYDDAVSIAQDDVNLQKSDEPEFESQEWKDWNKEQERLDGIAEQKANDRDDWKATHPEPPAPEKYENPKWTEWNSTLSTLEGELSTLNQDAASKKSIAESANRALEDAVVAHQNAQRALDDAIQAGAPQSVIDGLRSDLDAAWADLEAADSAAGEAASDWYLADQAASEKAEELRVHKTQEPDHWIIPGPSPEYIEWVNEWNRIAGEAQDAENEASNHRATEPKKESSEHNLWADILYSLELELTLKKDERDQWLSAHPEPAHERVTQEWKDWDSEKDRLSTVMEQKKTDLDNYDKKKPSKTIWVPITLYKCKLSASLDGTPPAGTTSHDTVTISLSAGKYKASVTLSAGAASDSAISAYESEDKPQVATLSLSSYEGGQSATIGEGTWTSNPINLRLE